MSASAIARHVATVLVIALACPLALFAGVNVTCSAGGMSAECANNGLLVAPLILLAAGVISAFLNRGVLGFVLGGIGVVLGMAFLWIVVAVVRGIMLPLDPVQGVIATIFFGIPPMIGWSLTRAGMWMFNRVAPA